MPAAYLSLGSNLGAREDNLLRVQRLLAGTQLRITRVSSIYETAPMELTAQPAFLNCVIEIETELSPPELLARIARVEADLGRQRTVPKGPRTADVDILLYGDVVIDTGDLTIPHPAMHQRRFVLEPLAELAPDLIHPVLHRAISDLRADTANQQVERYNP